MEYFKLMYDYNHSDGYAMCDKAELHGMNDRCVDRGMPLAQNWIKPDFTYQLDEGEILSDYLCNVKSWLMVSKRFVQATYDYMGESVEYLPVKLINRTTDEICEDYFILNVVNIVSALDFDHSDYSVFNVPNIPPFYSIKKYALLSDQIGNHHIIKLKEDTVPIFISKSLKSTITKHHLTGFDFLQVAVY